jgi:hypothetical protein
MKLNQLQNWNPVRAFSRKKITFRGPHARISLVMATVHLSGCSGLDAWLRYNDGEASGCFIKPIVEESVSSVEDDNPDKGCPEPIARADSHTP